MSSLFRFSDRKDFSGIENWDVSEVTNMSEMFSGAESFNQDLNNWDVFSVTNMKGMFENAGDFSQDLNNWDVSNVKNADWMFCNAKKYRGSMKNWNFSNSMDHEPEDFLKGCIIWSMYNGPNDLPSLPFMQSKQRRMSPPEPGIIFHAL